MKRRAIKFIDNAAWVLVIPALLYFLFPSSMFLNVQKTEVVGEEVIFSRLTPYGTITARWHSEITLLDGTDRECSSGRWNVSTYQKTKSNTVVYNLGSWADDCLAAGNRYTLTTTRQVLLFAWLPLRPFTLVDTIEIPEETK